MRSWEIRHLALRTGAVVATAVMLGALVSIVLTQGNGESGATEGRAAPDSAKVLEQSATPTPQPDAKATTKTNAKGKSKAESKAKATLATKRAGNTVTVRRTAAALATPGAKPTPADHAKPRRRHASSPSAPRPTTHAPSGRPKPVSTPRPARPSPTSTPVAAPVATPVATAPPTPEPASTPEPVGDGEGHGYGRGHGHGKPPKP